MADLNLNRAEFIKSAADPGQFIHSSMPSVVFAGKSNVGKSSVINRLLNRKNFARVGNTPGKTVHINYFLIDGKMYFVDLPGYGFADVSKSERERWGKLMESYFSGEDIFRLGILIVDSRHKPTSDDISMKEYFAASGKPYLIVANKTDKLKKSELERNIPVICETLKLDSMNDILPFSAEKGTGRDLLIKKILEMK